jgi:hypothetical protein
LFRERFKANVIRLLSIPYAILMGSGLLEQHSQEMPMPAYDICYLDDRGALTYKFSANCDNDQRPKVMAHARKLPSMKRLEVWNGPALVYTRPSAESGPFRSQRLAR